MSNSITIFLCICVCILHPALVQVDATVYTVIAGLSSNDSGSDLNGAPKWNIVKYYPNSLSVAQGDVIDFQFQSSEPHTVTWYNNTVSYADGNPALLLPIPGTIQQNNSWVFDGKTIFNTGLLNWQSSNFRLTVQAPVGTYLLYCAIHINMFFQLTVQRTPNNQSPDLLYSQAVQAQKSDQSVLTQQLLNTSLVTANLNQRDWPLQNAQRNANGSTTWTVLAGYGLPTLNASSARFYPTIARIRVGDTIIFDVGYDFFPHTVTFNGTGDLINGQVISYPQGDSRTTFDGVGVANSGELIIPASAAAYGSPARYPTTYTLTFTTAGTYRYKCLLHDSIGMIGYVVVSP